MFVDNGSTDTDGFQCLGNNRTRAVRPGSRDEVDQLPPAYCGIVPIARRMLQYCE